MLRCRGLIDRHPQVGHAVEDRVDNLRGRPLGDGGTWRKGELAR
jgi:hypothetical protein